MSDINKISLSFLLILTLTIVLSGMVLADERNRDIREHGRNVGSRAEVLNNDELLYKTNNGRSVRVKNNEIIVKFIGKEKFERISITSNRNIAEALSEYGNRNDVIYAEPNFIATAYGVPNDPFYPYQWHFDNPTSGGVDAEEAWDINNGSGVVVAVIDTGIAYEDYTQNVRNRYYLAPDLANTNFVEGYDFVNNDTHANDDEAHGTHVAGTIAGSTNNSVGVAGLANGATLMPVKVLNGNGTGSYADIADGIIFAADQGAKVINMSLGGPSPASYLEDALEYAYNKGVTIVAASGNDGTNQISYPAAYNAYVIAVGATRLDETKSYYSNYGLGLDVVAPGGDLNVDQNGDGYGDGVLQQTFGNQTNNFGYYFYHGTSMATPHVAAIAAMVISNGNGTTPDEVRSVIEGTAKDLGSAGWDDTYGHGLVNARAALEYSPGPVDNPPSILITAPNNGAIVSGNVLISADAGDDNAVERVEFFLNGGLVETDSVAPYETNLDTTSFSDGSYPLSAKVFDDAGQSSSDSINILVDNVNDPPVADAGNDQDAFIGNAVILDGSNSSDSDGTIVSFDWDFGDGSNATGTVVSHTYNAVGDYSATLTVTDNLGETDSDTALVYITEVPNEVVVFSDSFEVSEWNGLWSEDSQNDWKRSRQRATEGMYSAEVDGRANDALLTSIPIDLAGRTNAKVSFNWYIENRLDSGEYVAFEVSTNEGSTWTEIDRIRGNIDQENVWHTRTHEINGISDLIIRFVGNMSASSEDANVDEVEVLAF